MHIYIVLANKEEGVTTTSLFSHTPKMVIYVRAENEGAALGLVMKTYREKRVQIAIRNIVAVEDDNILQEIVTVR